MTATWTPEELRRIGAAHELQIASRRADGTLRGWVPIWVVSTGGQVYVRTWYRRDTGWFGHALRSQRARIRVPGLEADVTIVDIGDTSTQVTTDVDAAYRAKYGPGGAGDPHPCRLRRVASRTGVGDNGGMPEPRRVAVR